MLATLGAATADGATVPPGAHVLVRQGAALSRPNGEWSAVPDTNAGAWPASVLLDHGDILRVQLDGAACVPPLTVSRALEAPFNIREADLLPMLLDEVAGQDASGQPWPFGAALVHGSPS